MFYTISFVVTECGYYFFMFDYNQQTLYILLQSAQTVSQLNGLTGVPAHTTQLETVYR